MKDESQPAAASQGITIGGAEAEAAGDVSNDDDMRAALAFMREQEEKTVFRDRLAMELEKEKKKAHHTRTIVKIKFPNNYTMEATFGLKERIKDVYDFVKSMLVTKDRSFILYTVPPKTILTKMNQTLKEQGFGRGSNVYFGWKDLDQTTVSDGPFLDFANNRDKMMTQ